MKQSPPPMQLPHRFLALLTIAATAIGTGSESMSKRTLTLEECIQMALQRNLDIQIQRYAPVIARANLSVSYAIYDPAFTSSAGQSFATSESGFNPSVFNPPSNESWVERYDTGIAGTAPTGLKYNLTGTIDRFSGKVFTTNTFDSPFDYRTSVGINLTQPLLKNFWIDAPRLQISLNKRNLKISELTLRQQIILTVTGVETAYYNLIFAQENVKVQEAALQLAERLLAENKKRVEVGAMAQLEEKQAESEVAARRADLLTAQRALQAQQNVLKNLVTDDYSSWHPVEIDPAAKLAALPYAAQLQDSWQKGLTMRPDLLQSRLNLEKQNIQLKYDRNQLFPQLDLLGSFGYAGRDTDFSPALGDLEAQRNPNHSVGIQLSIPFSNRAARNNYKAGKAIKEQAVLQLKKLEQNIMVELDDAVGQVKTSFERVEATHQARLFAEAALDAEQKKLENGKSTSFVVLQLQKDLTTARSIEIRALADYNIALVNLAFSEGATLERNRIDVDVK